MRRGGLRRRFSLPAWDGVIDDWDGPIQMNAALSPPPPTVGRTDAVQGVGGRVLGGVRTFWLTGVSRTDEGDDASLTTFPNGPDASTVVLGAFRLNAIATLVWDGTERTFGPAPTVAVNESGLSPTDFAAAGSTIRMPIVPGYASAPGGTTLALTLYDGTHSATGTATLAAGDTAVEWALSGFGAVNTAAVTAIKLVLEFPPSDGSTLTMELGALRVISP